VDKVRSSMDSSKMSKQPGCSFIEVDGCVHEIFPGDRSYIQHSFGYERAISIRVLI
jgi:hypothetical protein